MTNIAIEAMAERICGAAKVQCPEGFPIGARGVYLAKPTPQKSPFL